MFRSRTVFVLAVLMAAAAVPVSAVYTSQLTGTLGTLDLVADVNWTGTVYNYSYVLTYTQSVSGGIVKTFQVENLGQEPFTAAWNSDAFTNPVYDPSSWSVDWLNGEMALGATVTFSYDSQYLPDVIPVYALAVDSGQSASGLTIGMSTYIPEPGSLVALGSMLLGAGALLRRARRRR